jgi:hypothetical protein
MAKRRKMPFVVAPGIAFASASFVASICENPLWFLAVIGVGSAFEMAAHPAITSVLRRAYPASQRAAAVGETRKWASLVFLISILGSAASLHWAGQDALFVIRLQLCLAGVLSLGSFLSFRRIRVDNTSLHEGDGARTDPGFGLAALMQPLTGNSRFRRYAASCFVFGFSGLLYLAYIEAILVRDLKLGYLGAAGLLHVIPSVASFLTTGYLGRWIDRTNPWTAWGWIRLGWGLDPVFLSVVSFGALPLSGAVVLAALARASRGTTMGASWVLWWRVGINHFAPPGADTSRYMGVYVFLNGIMRLVAPVVGGWLIYYFSRSEMLMIGGFGVIASSMHAFWEARRERGDPRLTTMAAFEAQFPSGR